jgi:pimeloyl-ACP methyl ester carboxylesterase
MGVDRIDYLGFSYGTYLGALYARAFPQHVRSMVLDGAVDPALDYAQTALEQAQGFERDLDAFLAHCRDEGCGFASGGDPFAAFDDLNGQIDAEPIPATVGGEQRTLGPGEFDIGVASALYGGHDAWTALGHALAQAAQGRGDELLAFSDDYTQRRPHGEYSNETAALYAVSCLDAPSPRSLATVQALARRVARAAPHLGPATVWLGLPCTYWPVPARGAVGPVHAPHAPPILVLGTTEDPATPYAWAQSLTAQLQSAHLLTATGESHTSYGRGDDCVDGAVDRYLLKLDVPAGGTRCG